MSGETTTGTATDEVASELADIVLDIAEGRTDLAAVAGLTDRDLEAIYAVGHGLYTAGKYDEALNFFQVLCICRQTESRFWFGLGACAQVLGDAGTALRAYGMAAVFDTENPQISLRAAECLIKLGDATTARTAFEAVVELTEGKPQFTAYRERARLAIQQLDRKGAAA
ncbi:MAG: SycD/LcrH family type III secretion system chaperone [Acetobacteraceae bacterium]